MVEIQAIKDGIYENTTNVLPHLFLGHMNDLRKQATYPYEVMLTSINMKIGIVLVTVPYTMLAYTKEDIILPSKIVPSTIMTEFLFILRGLVDQDMEFMLEKLADAKVLLDLKNEANEVYRQSILEILLDDEELETIEEKTELYQRYILAHEILFAKMCYLKGKASKNSIKDLNSNLMKEKTGDSFSGFITPKEFVKVVDKDDVTDHDLLRCLASLNERFPKLVNSLKKK